DVVLTLDGLRTDSPQEVMFRLAALGIGREVVVKYLHDGEEAETKLTLIAPPDSPPREAVTLQGDRVLHGLSVSRINPAVAAELDLPDSSDGVVVTGADGLAARVGLRPGDVIRAINGTAVERPADVEALTAPVQRRWAVEVLRDGEPMLLRFRI
ncbi:MAG: PDZ domain-containing protein, partial [Gemmobacter sp.]